jgi:hypothetical protein
MTGLRPHAAWTALLLLATAPTSAATQDEHAGHHPPAGAQAEAGPPKAAAPAKVQPGMMGGMAGMMMPGHIEEHLSRQRGELGITPAQAGAWTAYADALRKAARDMDGMHRTMMEGATDGAHASPLDRLDRHERMLGVMRDILHGLRPPLAALYAALSPGQKQQADALLMMPGMMRGMPMRRPEGM